MLDGRPPPRRGHDPVPGRSSSSHRLAVDSRSLPQTAAVLATRAEPLGVGIVTADLHLGLPDGEILQG